MARISSRWNFFLVLGILWAIAGTALAQVAPSAGATVAGKVSLGRNTLLLPPGNWQVIWMGEATTGIIGDGAKNPLARFIAAQRDGSGTQIRAIVSHVSTLVSTAGTYQWNTSACDKTDALHKEFSGNFKFPECLFIDYWITPTKRPASNVVQQQIWDWAKANNLQLPTTFLAASFIKYQGGDYLQTFYYINPQAIGLPASVQRERVSSEWNAAQLKTDPQRLGYVDQLKKWGVLFAEQSRPTVAGGSAKVDMHDPIPEAIK